MAKQRSFLTIFTLYIVAHGVQDACSKHATNICKECCGQNSTHKHNLVPMHTPHVGDSLSDTGNLRLSDASNPHTELGDPYGMSYLKQPTGWYNDERLVIYFLAEGLGIPSPPPIQTLLAGANINSKHGTNFVYAGATACAKALITPFHLQRQVAQFLDLKSNSMKMQSFEGTNGHGSGNVMSVQDFDQAAYIIHVGGNNLFYAYTINGSSPTEAANNVVPESVGAIVSSISELYNAGARNFLVFNQPPQGCVYLVLTVMGTLNATREEYECLADFNMVTRVFNQSLHDAIASLRASNMVEGAKIYIGDYYKVNYDIISNPGSFGFWRDTILRASCGVGEPYNYNSLISCGHNGTLSDGTIVDLRNATSLADPSQLINWDGIHFT